MPSITDSTSSGGVQKNGKPGNSILPMGRKENSWMMALKAATKPDVVAIGCKEYKDEPQDETASWEDVAKVVDRTKWLVKGWVPYGMLSGVIAQPKLGKSCWVLYSLVRPVITGCGWFDGGAKTEPGNVVWCDTEGSIGLNIDRAKKWKIPMERIKVPFQKELFKRIDIDNDEHIKRITDVVCKYEARLVVVDSFRGAHTGDENNSKVAAGLNKLAEMAEKTRTAVHIIHHTNKLAPDAELDSNSGRGSGAFLAMVRCLIGINRPNLKSEWRKFAMLDGNFGSPPQPRGFRITANGLEFGEAPTRPREDSRKQDAEDWLRTNMKPGVWYLAKEMTDKAKDAGFSPNALQRARESMLITTDTGCVRTRNDGRWEWSLPDPLINGGASSL